MGLRINTNITAIRSLRHLGLADRAQAKSLERLSTGLRINRAADDPSGLAIAVQLRAQIASLNKAVENTENANSMLGTAEAALAEVSDQLLKIMESIIFVLNEGVIFPEQIEDEQRAVDYALGLIARAWGHFGDFKDNMRARQSDDKVESVSKVLEMKCPRCGAPIPVDTAGLFSCSYCGGTLKLS